LIGFYKEIEAKQGGVKVLKIAGVAPVGEIKAAVFAKLS
jgi:hypothetical protein